MNTHSHDFVTVDLCSLKSALVTRARSDPGGASVLVRCVVERDLVVATELHQPVTSADPEKRATKIKLSIRVTS